MGVVVVVLDVERWETVGVVVGVVVSGGGGRKGTEMP